MAKRQKDRNSQFRLASDSFREKLHRIYSWSPTIQWAFVFLRSYVCCNLRLCYRRGRQIIRYKKFNWIPLIVPARAFLLSGSRANGNNGRWNWKWNICRKTTSLWCSCACKCLPTVKSRLNKGIIYGWEWKSYSEMWGRRSTIKTGWATSCPSWR